MIRRIKSKSLGRLELLSWLNNFLEADYSKIEHLGDGIAYCQIVDSAYPGKFPLEKLNFNATYVEQRVKNLRLLQSVLSDCGVKKEVPAKELAACKFQSNLAFLQWSYAFLHESYPDAVVNYRAYERRQDALEMQKARGSRRGSRGTRKKKTIRGVKPRASQGYRLGEGEAGTKAHGRSAERAPLARGSPGTGSRLQTPVHVQHEMAETMVGNLNLVPKSYTMRPGTKKTPPRNTMLQGGGSPPMMTLSGRKVLSGVRGAASTSPKSASDAAATSAEITSASGSASKGSRSGTSGGRKRGSTYRQMVLEKSDAKGSRAAGRTTYSALAILDKMLTSLDNASSPRDSRGVEVYGELLVQILEQELTGRLREVQVLDRRVKETKEQRDDLFETLRVIERAVILLGGEEHELLRTLYETPTDFS